MVITIASWKGGQGKSTTAIHLAAFYQRLAPTLVIDNDPNKTVIHWGQANKSRAFTVVSDIQAAREIMTQKYQIVINDTPARPEKLDLKGLIEASDLVIIPCNPDIFSLRTLLEAAQELTALNASTLRILLTNVPPHPQKDGAEARRSLEQLTLPLFKGQIRQAKGFKHAQVTSSFVYDIRDAVSMMAWNDYEGIGEEINAYLTGQGIELPTSMETV
jgi:chromosome partitioning protein